MPPHTNEVDDGLLSEGTKAQEKPRQRRRKSSKTTHQKSSKTSDHSTTNLESRSSGKKRLSTKVVEIERQSSSDSPKPSNPSTSKTSLAYPSFSKAHSKEAVGSRDNVNVRLSYYTPDPTDLNQREKIASAQQEPTGAAPPSPPLTNVEIKDTQEAVAEETRSRRADRTDRSERVERVERKRTDLQKAAEDLKRRLKSQSTSSLGESNGERHRTSRSSTSYRERKEKDGTTLSARRSKPGTPSKLRPESLLEEDRLSTTRRSVSSSKSALTATDTIVESSVDSQATSVAPNQPAIQRPFTPADRKSSPPSEPDTAPQTPTLTEPDLISRKETPAFSIINDESVMGDSPMPPPPPPPPSAPIQIPKVDYLLQNGGLNHSVTRLFLAAGRPPPPNTSITNAVMAQLNHCFAPYSDLLDSYHNVISKNGSVAVATGYRSVARRLLDRLEAVFARDISFETCRCIMCLTNPVAQEAGEDEEGVSWGEILEYVSGRRELPHWPPFVMETTENAGLGINIEAPMQKLDIDVPEEYRDHYVRQSRKTKLSVDRWLQCQDEAPTSAPQDVDDETLTFAMLTRLEPEQRPLFSSIAGVAPTRPASRLGAPSEVPKIELLENTGLAIQRLYRLQTRPRDPESAIFLLTSPHLHNVLATLAAISDAEWEILVSGRFDGFLRSGAEDPLPQPSQPMMSRGPSRTGPTPLSRSATPARPISRAPTPYSRGPTATPAPAASAGGPIAFDEETEIAALAEVEREIFVGMEALEDAFEALHLKAETVRRILRERSAGLSMASQIRKGGGDNDTLDARMGTPYMSGGIGVVPWESETDDDTGWGVGGDGMSELAPDDSASNVSRSRVRRPKRRKERMTPAPVEEEDEESNF